MAFLPINRKEMLERGWESCDFVYVIGDAYVDHPSFGHAIISRVLEANGYSVGIISQPDWKNPKSIDVFGRPRLGFLVSGGNMDSMVNHYSVSKRRRKTDAFTPGGVMGKRPDYATICTPAARCWTSTATAAAIICNGRGARAVWRASTREEFYDTTAGHQPAAGAQRPPASV